MKRTSIAMAAAAMLTAAGVHAQSNVQMYGLLDLGVDYMSDAAANGKSVTRVSSGGMNTSRWGLRGSEDLGGGLKAVWRLEGGILMDTGAQDGNLFKRQATVGLEGAYGSLLLGRSFTSVYDTVIRFDPMGFAPFYSWATSGNATGPSKYGMTTGFDNLVKYAGSTGAFKYGVTYAFGEQAASSEDSAKIAAAVSYEANGLGLMGTWERINGNTLVATGRRDNTNAYHLGMYYETGPFKVWLAGRNYGLESGKAATPDVKANTYWTGLAYKPQPNVTLTGAIYYMDVRNVAAGKDADPIMYVARYRYALSKRTDLYATVGYAKAKHGQLVGLSRDDAGFADAQHGAMVGIQHRF
ncbi:porin [Massilia endophytica]|uniref:porin n=1 Tax=Massilia endophytica TaxID=2899220 RepID=UPI001E2FA62E|nr:porin [Massilia endophytica]UGQ49124.1 porin [Massilia endophytica]